jgi:hypothetical protein
MPRYVDEKIGGELDRSRGRRARFDRLRPDRSSPHRGGGATPMPFK